MRILDDVKTALKREQLLDIVEGTDEPPKPENDEALRVIKDSCDLQLGWAIAKISSAKIAWDTLAAICALAKSKLYKYFYISL